MSVQRNACAATYIASGTIAARRVVVAGTNEQEVAQASTAGTVVAYGIARHAASAGEAVDVYTSGTVKAEAGAAITRGADLSYDNQGRVVAAVSTNRVIGFAETAASAAGQIVEVRLGTPYEKA